VSSTPVINNKEGIHGLQETILKQYDYVKDRNDRTLAGLTREELVWRPMPSGFSIGMIYFHQARWMDEYLHSRCLDVAPIYGRPRDGIKVDMPVGEPRSIR